ncbi:chorismate synthase [uncultured Oscillibacter sp.]|uniref:chorismate synthase n=1 Tax=uncultured Oscillibacter sp. TaxID=876091 RepID=UPI001FA64AD8|nr:chorismate synthase [uncultured Oscillibacter sp.]HJB30962.1 chorismate synthase [Candidatus Oscillibacter excrementavium]
MSSEFGNLLKISVFGQSHGKAIGVVVDGLPAGEAIDLEELDRFLDRRRTGKNRLSTARKESDVPVFLSGLENGVTCGAPLCAVIENSDQHSSDYRELRDKPRPGHADYTAYVKWKGQADMRGGGHFSGRLTAPLCVAGGIAKQILARRGVYVGAHLWSVGTERDTPFPLRPTRELFESVAAKPFPVLDDQAGERMQSLILEARQAQDSVGGVIECAATGMPAGLGDPMFGGVENRLASALFGIPAVKGVEFGDGFAAARAHGSENNDPFIMEGGRVAAETNHAGGILGGITSGMPIVLRTAMKPTPSIARPQRTVSLSAGADTELVIHGRHDPCIAHRAVPVVEAVTAAVLLDLLLEGNHGTF